MTGVMLAAMMAAMMDVNWADLLVIELEQLLVDLMAVL